METQYKIEITSYGENPNYEAEKVDFIHKEQEKSLRNNYYNEKSPESAISKMKTERVLVVALTKEEYEKVKSEVIKVFK